MLIGGRGVSWPSAHFEALCGTSRKLAIEHLNSPLGVDVSPGGYNFNSLLPRQVGTNSGAICECGVYAMSLAKWLPENAVSGSLTKKVVARVLGWGTVHIGNDQRSWRASDATITEIWVPITVQMDGESVPGGAFSLYTGTFNWDAFCQDISDRYDCPVNLYFGQYTEKVVRRYLPPPLEPSDDWLPDGEVDLNSDSVPDVWSKGLKDLDLRLD